MEETLAKLAHDDGRGTLTVEQLRSQAKRDKLKRYPNPSNTISYSVPPELTVKINATTAQARRGSDEVSTGRLAEMLDEDKLGRQLLREDVRTEKPTADEAMVVQTVVSTLT